MTADTTGKPIRIKRPRFYFPHKKLTHQTLRSTHKTYEHRNVPYFILSQDLGEDTGIFNALNTYPFIVTFI